MTPQQLYESLSNGLELNENEAVFETFRSAYTFKMAFPEWEVSYVGVAVIEMDEEWVPDEKCNVPRNGVTAVPSLAHELPGEVDANLGEGRVVFNQFPSAYQFKMAYPEWRVVWLRPLFFEVAEDALWPE